MIKSIQRGTSSFFYDRGGGVAYNNLPVNITISPVVPSKCKVELTQLHASRSSSSDSYTISLDVTSSTNLRLSGTVSSDVETRKTFTFEWQVVEYL